MIYSDRVNLRAWLFFIKDSEYRLIYSDIFKRFHDVTTTKALYSSIEQCTGLKDKNGRLIYEGDIVQHDTAAGPKCWPVVFRKGCFVLPYESGDAWLGKVIEHCPYDSGVVVVGNIHETPELLEEKK